MEETDDEETENKTHSCKKTSPCQHDNICKQIKNYILNICHTKCDGLDKGLSVIYYLYGIVLIYTILFITKELAHANNLTSRFVQESHLDILLMVYILPAVLWTVCFLLMRNDSNMVVFDNDFISQQPPLFYAYGIYLFAAAFCFSDFLQVVLHLRCNTMEHVRAVYLCVEALFVLTQLSFLVSFTNAKFFRRSSTRLAVLHMVGTNVSVWLHVVFRRSSAKELIEMSSRVNQTHVSNEHFPNYCENAKYTVNRIVDILHPLDLQYLVVSLAILIYINLNIIDSQKQVEWFSSSPKMSYSERNISLNKEMYFRRRSQSEGLSTSSMLLPDRGSFFQVDLGLLTGLLLTLSLLVLTQLLVKSEKVWPELLVVYNVYQIIMLSVMLCVNWFIAWLLYHFYPFYFWAPFSPRVVILFISTVGLYAHNTFQILVILTVMNTWSVWLIINCTVNLCQGFIQTFVICKALGHLMSYCSNNVWCKYLTHAVKFLVICNASMALHEMFFDSPSVLQMKEMHEAFFGKRTWNIITSTVSPLNILYWFHSATCFLDIWFKYQL